MCGLAGIVGRPGEEAPVALVERMAGTLLHRGPDDHGVHAAGSVALGFRRLSILDLTPAGHQPFLSPDGRVAMVYNGEIYNYAELREELRALGHDFRSTGDSEVLLAAYLQWGVECLPRLNGMWAFLIHDGRTGVVFGARDRFGVKPLFHTEEGGRHYFASEIKAFHAVAPASRDVDPVRVATFLAAGRLEWLEADGRTFFRAVREVPPGSWFQLEPGGALRTGTFWTLPEEEVAESDEGDLARAFREVFLDAVALRLRSDVPVGVSLSGGLDSTAIISAMARMRDAAGATTPLHAFSYLSPGHDETRYVTSTLEQTRATAHAVEFGPDRWWRQMPAILAAHDEPVHSATASVGYEIYRAAAAQGVKVMLVGQGADETWGGYPSYFDDHWYSLLRGGRLAEAVREIGDFSAGHGGSRGRRLAASLLRFVLTTAGRLAAYRALMAPRQHARAYPWASLLSPELRRLLPERVPAPPRGLRAALVHGTTRTPLPLYLRIEDRNSMAHSVEARLPFMDYRLVSLAFRLSGRWKVRGRWNKYLLRQGARGVMPEVVRTRVDKMGFPTQMNGWIRRELAPELDALLAGPSFAQRGWFAPSAARAALERHRAGQVEAGSALFNLAQTELWLEGLATRSG